MISPRIRRRINRVLFPYVPLTIVLIVLLFPFYWMLITSLKSLGETYNLSTPLIVKAPTLSNYVWLFTKSSFRAVVPQQLPGGDISPRFSPWWCLSWPGTPSRTCASAGRPSSAF